MKLSRGKWSGLSRVSTANGVIAALAIDQRSALRSLLAKAKNTSPEAIPASMLHEFKEAVSRALTPHASAILLDPEFGLSAAKQRASTSGLLLAYERSGYDKSIPGRFPYLLDGWSATRLMEAGADCVKVLLYYSPFSTASINDVKQAWIERIGAECAALDVPFFLELVVYDDAMEDKSLEFARIKPQSVNGSLHEFSKPRYAVDVFKIGFPVNMAFVGDKGSGNSAYTRAEAIEHIRQAAKSAAKPFIYLSEGVSNKVFDDALELAAKAGANFSGVLCGRATWKDGVEIYATQGRSALEEWLQTRGVENILRVNQRLRAAVSWHIPYEIDGATLSAQGSS